MDKTLAGIVSNLRKKGLSNQEIPRFIKDFHRTIEWRKANHPNFFAINRRLINLGWEHPLADYHLYELMIDFQERYEEFRIDRIFPQLQLQFEDMEKTGYTKPM